MTPRQVASFVRKHGIVLESAAGPVPSVAAAIAGEPIRGSFRVSQKENDNGTMSPFFVSILTGPDNWSNYRYLGTISVSGNYAHGRKSKISNKAPSARCITWLMDNIRNEDQMARIEFWHCGKCGMCGRKLTVPESIESGIGPICARR